METAVATRQSRVVIERERTRALPTCADFSLAIAWVSQIHLTQFSSGADDRP